MSFGDVITIICLLIALWYVPRYLLRVYAPGLYMRIKLSIESAVRDLQERDYQRYLEKQVRKNSGAAHPPYGAGTGSAIVVPPQQHQAASEPVLNFEVVKRYLTEHNLSDEQAIELLALIRRIDGNDLLSANKIRDIVGGNEGKVKAKVAAHRRPRPRPKVAARIERPANGW